MHSSAQPTTSTHKALQHWDDDKDTLQEKPSTGWKASDGGFEWEHSRPLPLETAQKAMQYIGVLTKQYPFQLRYVMALPLWHRFSQEWCETGDETKALKAI